MWSNYFFKNVYHAPPPQPTSLKISKFWDYRIFFLKNVQILTFIFYHSGGKKDVLTFHLGILEKKVITPVVFTCPSFFIRQCVAYTL